MMSEFPVFKRPVTKTTKTYTQRFDVDVDEDEKPKVEKHKPSTENLPTRNDVDDLCDLAASVYHTDAPYTKKGKVRQPNRGRVWKVVTRVRAKLGGLP